MPIRRGNQRMREQLHQKEISRVINPAACRAGEVVRRILCVCPKPSLECIGGSVAIANFTDIPARFVIEAKNRMGSSSSAFFVSDFVRVLSGTHKIKDHHIATLLFLIVDEWKYIDIAKLTKSWVIKNTFNGLTPINNLPHLLQSREHSGIFVGGKLKRPITIRLEADGEINAVNLVGDAYIFLMFFGSIQILANMSGFEVVHILVYEFRDCYLGQIPVRFVANEPHCKNVAQRYRNEMRVLAYQMGESLYEIAIRILCGFHGVHLWIESLSMSLIVCYS